MPSPFYNTEGLIGLRKLLGTSKVHDIGTGIVALGEDVEKYVLGQSLVEHATSLTAKGGELVLMTGAGQTVTSPAAALNQAFGVFSTGGATKIKVATGEIFGDFISGAKTIELATYQHVILRSNGTNWFIVAGEPRNEGVYSALTSRVSGTEYEPSATRDANLSLIVTKISGAEELVVVTVEVGGIKVGVYHDTIPTSTGQASISVLVPAGKKWKALILAGTVTLESTYLLR